MRVIRTAILGAIGWKAYKTWRARSPGRGGTI